MKVFRDGSRREWTVAITVGSLTRAKELAGVDLTDLTAGEKEQQVGVRLSTSHFLVGEVLAALCRPQLEKHGLAKDDFLELLDGETLAQAFAALTEELLDFFQKSGRTEQAAALRAMLEALIATHKLATLQVEAIDIEKLVQAEFSRTAGGSAGSSGSTPVRSPSASSS